MRLKTYLFTIKFVIMNGLVTKNLKLNVFIVRINGNVTVCELSNIDKAIHVGSVIAEDTSTYVEIWYRGFSNKEYLITYWN